MQNIGFLIYDGVQPLDVIGPWEVLSIWSNVLKKSYSLYMVSEYQGIINCDSNLKLESHVSFNNCPKLDYLFVPGGRGRKTEVQNKSLVKFIQQQAQTTKLVLSICTGAFLLNTAGLLKGKKATTYWQALSEFKELIDVTLVEKRIVKDIGVWSAGGVSSGIDLALEFIKDIDGIESYKQAKLLLEYFPEEEAQEYSQDIISSLPKYTSGDDNRFIPEYINSKKRY